MLFRRLLILSFLVAVALCPILGQEHLYQTLTVKDGLPSDYVITLFFDRQGTCWIGTDKGICRYDGQTFHNLTTDDGLKGNLIYTIIQDKTGNVWTGGDQTGLVSIIQKDDIPSVGRVYNPSLSVSMIKIDRKDRWWIKVHNARVPSEYTWMMTAHPDKPWHPMVIFQNRNGADVDSNGTIWYHPKSIIRWPTSGAQKKIAPFDYGNPAENHVIASGNMVAVTSEVKVRLFNTEDSMQARDLVLPGKAGASANTIFFQYKGSPLFYKSLDGAILFNNGQPNHIIKGTSQQNGYMLFSAAADAYGNLYFGHFGKGLLIWRNNYISGYETNAPVIRISLSNTSMLACTQTNVYAAQWPQKTIAAMAIPGVPYIHFAAHDWAQRPLIGTHGTIHNLSGNEFSPFNARFSDFSDLLSWHGRSYISSYSAGLASLGIEDALPGLVSTNIPLPKGIERLRADSQYLYLLTLNKGFFTMAHPTLEAKQISKANGMLSNMVYDVWRQHDTIWAGTAGGLNKYVNGKIWTYSHNEGLIGTKIIAVFKDRMGRLWALSDKYLHLFIHNRLYAIRSHPFLVDRNTYATTAAYQQAGDQLWIGTNHSIQRLDMASIHPGSESMPLTLKRIQSGQQDLASTGNFRLMAEHEPLVFHIQSPKYSIYTQPEVYLRIQGLDTNWLPLNADGKFRLNRLPAGSYTVEIKSQGPDLGNIPARALVSFVVLNPWWKSVWFLACCVVAAALSAFGISRHLAQRKYQRRLLQVKAEQAIQLERNRISRELHDNVGSMLTVMINRLEDDAENLPAERHQSLISIARNTLSQLRDAIWALDKNSLTMAQWTNRSSQYLQQLDSSETAVSYHFDWPPNTKMSPVKALHTYRIMQEACTNALKHSGASAIEVSGTYQNSWYILTIRDNGKGFDPQQIRMGYGLKNMEKRAGEIHAKLDIASRPEKGATITIQWLHNEE